MLDEWWTFLWKFHIVHVGHLTPSVTFRQAHCQNLFLLGEHGGGMGFVMSCTEWCHTLPRIAWWGRQEAQREPRSPGCWLAWREATKQRAASLGLNVPTPLGWPQLLLMEMGGGYEAADSSWGAAKGHHPWAWRGTTTLRAAATGCLACSTIGNYLEGREQGALCTPVATSLPFGKLTKGLARRKRRPETSTSISVFCWWYVGSNPSSLVSCICLLYMNNSITYSKYRIFYNILHKGHWINYQISLITRLWNIKCNNNIQMSVIQSAKLQFGVVLHPRSLWSVTQSMIWLYDNLWLYDKFSCLIWIALHLISPIPLCFRGARIQICREHAWKWSCWKRASHFLGSVPVQWISEGKWNYHQLDP